MRIAESICFQINKSFLKRKKGREEAKQTFSSSDHYRAWRRNVGEKFLKDYFPSVSPEGKRALDFGSSFGDFSFFLAEKGASFVYGIDVSEEGVRKAKETLVTLPTEIGSRIHFERCGDEKIPLPDGAVDVIFSIDVMEHVTNPEAVLNESYRVLSPGGKLAIAFTPWWHPFGAHVRNLIPIPWCHRIFSERTLINVAARVYDSPYYHPAIWDHDPKTGKKRENKWIGRERLTSVNGMTVKKFREQVKASGFTIDRLEQRYFSGTIGRLSKPLLKVPYLNEYITSLVVAVLKK